ncbi:MAG: glycosyltransferase family 4 protein [Candidatus Micrarchaeota archaeon]
MQKIQLIWELYSPENEGASQEIDALAKAFQSFICSTTNHSFSGKWIEWNKEKFVFDSRLKFFAPAPLIIDRLGSTTINHLFASYSSFKKNFFLNNFTKPTVLTITSNLERVKGLELEKARFVVVGSKKQLEKARSIVGGNCAAVLPGVDLTRFKPSPPPSMENLRIVSASSCVSERDFKEKGFELLLRSLTRAKNVEASIAWRGTQWDLLNKRVEELDLRDKTRLFNKVVDMPGLMAESHCAVLVPLSGEVGKDYPNSLIEALASGRPIIASRSLGISEVIEKEKCGLVVEPEVESLAAAFNELKRNYGKYQRNCVKTAKKFFSQERFVNDYAKIYKKAETKPADNG